MEYRIKQSFYSPNNEYSGLAGRVIDEELYNNAIKWGFKDRVEIVGYVPATFRSDSELDQEIAELLAEKEKRESEKAKIVDVKVSKKEDDKQVSETTKKGDKPSKK